MPRSRSAITLVELLIAIVLLSIIVLGLGSIDFFSRYHLIASDRRARLQNEISFALEHMTKNIIQGIGDQGAVISTPVVSLTYDFRESQPIQPLVNGFRVRVDRNDAVTPQDFGDDVWFSYILAGNTLTSTCAPAGRCPPDDTLATRIVAGAVQYGPIPTPIPANLPAAAAGYYINIIDNGTTIEVALVGRFDPARDVSTENPQIQMKATVHAQNAAAR